MMKCVNFTQCFGSVKKKNIFGQLNNVIGQLNNIISQLNIAFGQLKNIFGQLNNILSLNGHLNNDLFNI